MFLILEGLAFTILLRNNLFHNSWGHNFTQTLTGNYYEKMGNVKEYFSLREINRKLAGENAALRNQIENVYKSDDIFFYAINDTIHKQKYFYTTARVINNSINKKQNFLTLDKGYQAGIRPEMGVISATGIVGTVYGVSRNFSTVISVLNTDFRVSAKILKNDYYGSLEWIGTDHKYASLTEIPDHVDVAKGDTIVTSGYSTIFPEGILIGVVDNTDQSGGNFQNIRVALSTDFKKLIFIEVVGNLQRTEQIELEQNNVR
jgi:rod shape-determining protein MreC